MQQRRNGPSGAANLFGIGVSLRRGLVRAAAGSTLRRPRDVQLRRDVLDELAFDPFLSGAAVEVSVLGRVVTLQGVVETQGERTAALNAARRVRGVREVIDRLDVSPFVDGIGDSEIAARAVARFDQDLRLRRGAVHVHVEAGWVTLSGTVARKFQRTAAETDVRRLPGVRGVRNDILVSSETMPVVRAALGGGGVPLPTAVDPWPRPTMRRETRD